MEFITLFGTPKKKEPTVLDKIKAQDNLRCGVGGSSAKDRATSKCQDRPFAIGWQT